MSPSRLLASFLLLLAPGLPATAPREPAVELPARAALPVSGLVARGDVGAGAFIDAPGRRSAWLGTEDGALEAWVYPLKVVHALRLSFHFQDRTFTGRELARTVEVRPEWTAITYGHEAFRVREIVAVPEDAAAALILLEVDASRPLTIEVAFQIDLHPMWPAGLGGQYSYWDADLPGFVLGEGSGHAAAVIASPAATDPTIQPAHSLPDQPTRFAIHVDPAVASEHVYPVVLAAWTDGMRDPASAEDLRALYLDLAADPLAALAGTAEHYRALESRSVGVRTPEPRLDDAYRWARVRLDQGLVCNPDLGCGMVAGYATSGAGYRPGFGWFFGGDALYNSWALGASGAHDTVRTALEFLATYQRDDGKIMHELSQGAGTLDWFADYPYGYYHAEGSPYFIDAVARHVRATGDLDWGRRMLPALRRALAYCLAADTDGDGLMENTVAGLGAVEMGALRQARVHQDIYLASVWTRALESLSWLAGVLGDAGLADDARTTGARARDSLERLYWIESRGYPAFATTTDGGKLDELTLWSALPAALGLATPEHGAATVAAIASPAVTTDWGTRMLASTSDLYDPLIYNQGTVWPFLSGFAAMAAWSYGDPWYGRDLLDGLVDLTRDHARGAIAEVLSGDRYEPMRPAVPHQLFSTSSLVTPLLGGLFGLDIDAAEGRAILAPRLPDDWPAAALENIPYRRDGRLSFELEQRDRRLRVRARYRGDGEPPRLDLAPGLPPGADHVAAHDAGGAALPIDTEGTAVAPIVHLQPAWTPTADGVAAEVVITWRGGYRLSFSGPRATAAGASTGLRVLGADWVGGGLEVTVAGRPDVVYRVRVTPDSSVRVVRGVAAPAAAAIDAWELEAGAGVGEYRLRLLGSGRQYRAAVLRIGEGD